MKECLITMIPHSIATNDNPSKATKVVIALGGNALMEAGTPPTAEEQLKVVKKTCENLADISCSGYEMAVVHGNGPQVGRLVLQQEIAAASQPDQLPAIPFDCCGAMTEGYIGYQIQQSLRDALRNRNRNVPVVTLVTQVIVDESDPAFEKPTKPIGRFYSAEEAEKVAKEKGWTMKEDSGRGWRRVVASPDPKKIVEADSILNLLDNEFIVIACGGGGIPVVRDYENKGCYKGVPAVIDKDLGGELLAEDCDADVLFLLTAVEHVAINFGKPNQEELEDITADEAERLADEGQFGKGSMEPKVRAAIKFARSRKGRTCIIGALDKAAETMAGLSGTRIHE